ncbi:MAG: hypothetical protein WC518_03860 [Patescibacteria group bacterium]
MVITISFFYYLYLLVLLFFLVYSLFNIYHLIRFGFLSLVNVLMIILYIILSAAFIIFSFQLLLAIDWQQPLLQIDGLKNLFNQLSLP